MLFFRKAALLLIEGESYTKEELAEKGYEIGDFPEGKIEPLAGSLFREIIRSEDKVAIGFAAITDIKSKEWKWYISEIYPKEGMTEKSILKGVRRLGNKK